MNTRFSAWLILSAAALLGAVSCTSQTATAPDKPELKLIPKPMTKPAAPAPKTASEVAHLEALKKQDVALTAGLRGQLLRVSMPYSARLKRRITAWVYLPPGYAGSTLRYPVAYILHGAPGGVRDCFVNARVHRVADDMIAAKKIAPLILIGWDGSGPNGLNDPTYYLNRRDGYAMEDFTVRELVPWVDKNFRTRADASSRALIGFSAGGFGAANLGLKHPNVWRVIASHAGFFNPFDDVPVMKKILGPPGILWKQNSPILLARSLPAGTRLHFYMDVGRDDGLLSEFKKMEAELKSRHIDFEAQIFPGDHTWEFLTQHYHDSLRFADERWKEMAQ